MQYNPGNPVTNMPLTSGHINGVADKRGSLDKKMNGRAFVRAIIKSSSSSSSPFPFEGNWAFGSVSPSFSVLRTTTGFRPSFEP